LKQFQGYQQLWKDAFRDILSIVLGEGPDDDPTPIDVDLPPVVEKDLQSLSAFVTSVVSAFPEAKVPEVLMTLLQNIDVDDLEALMKKIEENKSKIDQQQKEQQALMARNPQLIPGGDPKQAAAVKESYDQLAAAMVSLANKL
jgi:uncharacterized protein YqgV (UPF0045/DUF77 family)